MNIGMLKVGDRNLSPAKAGTVWPRALVLASYLLCAGCSKNGQPTSTADGKGEITLPPVPTNSVVTSTNTAELSQEARIVAEAASKIEVAVDRIPIERQQDEATILNSSVLLALRDKELAKQLALHKGSIIIIPIDRISGASSYISNLGPQYSNIVAQVSSEVARSVADSITVGIGDADGGMKISLVFIEEGVLKSVMASVVILIHEFWHVVGDEVGSNDPFVRAKNEVRAYERSLANVDKVRDFVERNEIPRKALMLEELKATRKKDEASLKFWQAELP